MPMNEHQRLLCELIRVSPEPHCDALGALGDRDFQALATRTKTQGLIAHAFPEAPEAWHLFHAANLDRIGKMLAEVEQIAVESHLPVILLENGAVARAWQCPGCFSFGDLDVLVRKEDMQAIDRVFRLRGFQGLPERGRTVYRSAGATFNIQTRLLTGIFSKLLKEPDFSELRANATGEGALMLAPEYLLLQLCIHAISHFLVAAPGITLYRDICWHLRQAKITWPVFTGLCRKFHLERQVRQVLSIAHSALSIEVPDYYRSAPLTVDLSSLFSHLTPGNNAKLNILRKLYFAA
jgi:hypothetical protein